MRLKNDLTAEAVRLENLIANDKDLVAIKAARTRWENKHRAYWTEVHAARVELEADPKHRINAICGRRGVDPADVMEVSR